MGAFDSDTELSSHAGHRVAAFAADVYFGIAAWFGYSQPFSELPVLSVVVVTFTMTAPMVAWMRFRGMRGRPVVEMAAVMPILAGLLLVLGWLAGHAEAATRCYRAIGSLPDAAAAELQAIRMIDGTGDM
jgi:hypothetical protein